VEPLTHALASLVLARAGQTKLPRYGFAMLVVSGVAADLDYFSYFGGPEAYLRFHRSVLHSISGSVLLICALALLFWVVARRRDSKHSAANSRRLRFVAAFAVCALGVSAHLLLDLSSGIGVQLFWPFRQKWIASDLLSNVDPWVLVLLVAGLLLPEVVRLVSEEIGERKKGPRGQRAAIITLILLLLYLGARAGLHSGAIGDLTVREYNGRAPLATGAFPSALSPFAWRGLVSTDNAIAVIEVSLASPSAFDPDRAVTRFKPDDSSALDAAQNSPAAKTFLRYARFPLASLERNDEGYDFMLRDMRFAPADNGADNIILRMQLSASLQITRQEFRYANEPAR
jgi:inner membrane protein